MLCRNNGEPERKSRIHEQSDVLPVELERSRIRARSRLQAAAQPMALPHRPPLPATVRTSPHSLLNRNRTVNRHHPMLLAARHPYRDPSVRHDLGRMDVVCDKCGALHWVDERTTHSRPDSAKFGLCCNHGKTSLPLLCSPPPRLLSLFTTLQSDAKHFRDHLWEYNRAFAFTSLGISEDHDVNDGRGPPVFRISGELCHHSGALLPLPEQDPVYAQLYFVFGDRSSPEWRKHNNQDLRRDIIEDLEVVIRQSNPYADIYIHAFHVLNCYPASDNIAIRLRVEPGMDRRRHNLPQADEVAVILPGDNIESNNRDILLRMKQGALRRISHLHASYVPLLYVLLFPYGEPGWHPLMKQDDGTAKLTLIRHTAFRLHDRTNEFSCLLRGERLLQRYIVDMWASEEQSRLFYLRTHQDNIRSAHYGGLQDALAADAHVDMNDVRRRVILPSSHIGSPRHMHEQYQDAMAIARYYRHPDLFITMTTNPKWIEITQELHPGQSPHSRPDLLTRVFHLKLKALLKDILDGIFGHVVAHNRVPETRPSPCPHHHLSQTGTQTS